MNNNSQYINALNFLLFSYFGITVDAKCEDILSCSVRKAFKDATQQGAYNTQLKEENKETSKNAQQEAENNLISKMSELLQEKVAFNGRDSFDEWHDRACVEIKEKFEDLPFTYGNAQKWVNMTLKYLYLIDIIFLELCPKKTDFRVMQGISSWLHVPVDSYIIEAIWKKEGTDKGKENSCLPIIKVCSDGHRGAYASEKVTSWSNWNYDNQYKKFQDGLRDMIGENKNPIDWEGPAWIEIAEKRKGKN